MRYVMTCIIVLSLPAFAVDCNVGAEGMIGIGLSHWSGGGDIWFTSTLYSQEPVYQAGLGVRLWLTEMIGVHAGLEYSAYNYEYKILSYEPVPFPKYNYNSLLVPVDIIYGISVGQNRMAIGVGFCICKQLSGTMYGTDAIPDSLLETTVGPELFLGYEIYSERIGIFPSFRYIYGINGLSERMIEAGDEVSNHYFLLGLGLFYRL